MQSEWKMLEYPSVEVKREEWEDSEEVIIKLSSVQYF